MDRLDLANDACPLPVPRLAFVSLARNERATARLECPDELAVEALPAPDTVAASHIE
jgi:hypothetical protein